MTTSDHRLVAVVVTYNRLEKLKLTLAHLLENPPQALAAIVVVNNASTDETAAWLQQQSDARLDTLHSTTNLGGAGGFERGMRHAMEQHKPDWVVVMDDDAWPSSGTLEAFANQNPAKDRAVAAAVRYPDGRICEMNRPSVNPFWSAKTFIKSLRKGRDGYHIPYEDFDTTTPRPIDLTSFVGLFLPRQIIETVGYPNPGLFLYGDDVIYTLGLRRQGFAIDFDPRLGFVHDCSTFENNKARAFRPLWKVYYAYRNGLMMYHKAAGPLFWAMVPALTLKWSLAAKRYDGDQAVYRRLMWRAIKDGLRGHTDRSHQDILDLTKT